MNDKRLVIVVDMINGFCKEGALHDKKIVTIIPNIIEQLKEVCESNRIFIADSHNEEANEFSSFPKHCIAGSSESEIIEELQAYIPIDLCTGDKIITKKNSTNACWCLDLDDILKKDYNEIVITGCCTDICVMQLALCLKTYINEKNRNTTIIVPESCVATFDIPAIHDAKEYQEFSLKLMKNAGIIIHNSVEKGAHSDEK